MQERAINYDPIYNTVERDDFEALVEVDRYADRTDAFDALISATEDHFWDPTDPGGERGQGGHQVRSLPLPDLRPCAVGIRE